MGVLDAFLTTWSNARGTFGRGAPRTGAGFDQIPALDRLASEVDRAAPGEHWSGGAARAYGGVNTEHQKVFDALGFLDQRLSAQIDRSAQIVSAGRRDLDAVRTWVQDAAACTPRSGDNNFRNDWMPDNPGFTGGHSAVEFVHMTYPGE